MPDQLKEVIESAQKGDELAKTRLINLMIDNGCMRRLNRYLYKNRLLEPDDTKSEFWLGVTRAISQVKHNIGDPLQFLSWRGLCQVRSALRKAIGRGVFYICLSCGKEGQLRRRGDTTKCNGCDSVEIETWQREIVPPDPNWELIGGHTKPDHTAERLDMAEFKLILTPREQEVFDLIMDGFDRDNARGYLRLIGEELGITGQCVNQYLKGIRWKYRLFQKYQ